MAKLEIPIIAYVGEINELIDEIKHLQTYKLSEDDEQTLIDRDEVAKIFANHVRVEGWRPGRKKGLWMFEEYPDGYYHSHCSECEAQFPEEAYIQRWHYCPNCGAYMREEGTF